ncbi:TlpA family protein disulfide reductase [Pseudoalteromonas denitrificans]|uniref:Thiol-disulfide isomerase or thioredoxin n=1 Tax=Pseudoalteromonas denitrificans DSM 6059 TaxID=1123010 RepID=A0A1I1LWP2_9GAMM|nr:TlpA disulfide reductase family protein [Pseudoalteromonas denitrificans]SFC74743.1 Thiol-disulfide isomerase or thioredoxin [Pseudoalteromonas denitrificans DSM 6059]
MNKKYWLISLLLMVNFNTNALQRGDVISSQLSQQLQLDPNKITLVDFFASWCVSCRIELPEVDALSSQLSQQPKGKGVEFIGIQVDEDPKVAADFLKEMNLSFRVVDDQSQQVIGAFEPIGMPALYYIRNNKILGIRYGAIPHIGKVISNDLKQLGLK